MSAGKPAEWMFTTAAAVRELIVRRLTGGALDSDARRAMEMAVQELDIIWEQLEGQTALLALERERYAEFFEFAPDAYVITDVGGAVREANLAALELLDVAAEDLVGKPLSAHVAEDHHVEFLTRMAALPQPAPVSWRARLRSARGEVRCQISVRPIALKRSGASGLCWLLRPD